MESLGLNYRVGDKVLLRDFALFTAGGCNVLPSQAAHGLEVLNFEPGTFFLNGRFTRNS